MNNGSMINIQDPKLRNRCAKTLVWACFFMYILMMGSKNVYTAEVVAIQDVFMKSKAEVSLAMTFYFITYAIGQVILAMLMGRINLRIYLTVTALFSSVLTVLIAFMPNLELIYGVCAVNGALQAGIYSGCMAVISKYLPKKMLPFANKVMTSGTAVASGISYGVPAIFVSIGRWDLPFIILGVIFFVSVVFFFVALTKMKKFPPVIEESSGHTVIVGGEREKPFLSLNSKRKKIYFFVLMMAVSLLSNTIYYAVMNWVPNLMHEVFDMPQGYSILITLLLPITIFFGSFVIITLCEKYKNIVWVSVVAQVFAIVFFFPLTMIFDFNIVVTMTLLALFICIGSAGREVFTGIMAFKMRTEINTGGYLAIINAVAAIAAGVIPPIAGLIIDAFEGVSGYGVLYVIVFVLAAVLILISVLFAIYCDKNIKGEKVAG